MGSITISNNKVIDSRTILFSDGQSFVYEVELFGWIAKLKFLPQKTNSAAIHLRPNGDYLEVELSINGNALGTSFKNPIKFAQLGNGKSAYLMAFWLSAGDVHRMDVQITVGD